MVHDRSGHPFQVQLSRELAHRGNSVLHSYAEFFQTPKGKVQRQLTDPMTFSVSGITLEEEFQKYSFKRKIQERQYAKKLVKQIHDFRPEVAIFSNTPPDALDYVYKKIRYDGIKMIFWVQDLYGLAIQRILRRRLWLVGDLIGLYYTWLERRLLKKSDQIVLITDDFLSIMHKWRIPQAKMTVIPNWAPLEDVPLRGKQNDWSAMHQLDGKFCLIYSGTLGMKHNPNLLLQVALRFKDNNGVRIVVVSEGLGADWLKEQKEQYALSNLILLKFQPFKILPEVLATSDILMALLEPSAGVFSVPSKVLTYMCAGRPLLLAVPRENLASRIVQKNNMGIVIDPRDCARFVDAAFSLYEDASQREGMGKRAREYAETNFDISKITDQFESVIRALLRQ